MASFDSDIIINEVETNPAGSDTSEFVELYNPTAIAIDVSGWSISPSATWKTLEIPDGTIIRSQIHLLLLHMSISGLKTLAKLLHFVIQLEI